MSQPTGAYGLRLGGPRLADIDSCLADIGSCPPAWPDVTIEVTRAEPLAGPGFVGVDQAEIPLSGGVRAVLSRPKRTIHLHAAGVLPPGAIAHPYLAQPASVHNWWIGRDTLHAAVVSVDGQAWGILGVRGDGKSSTVAELARMGATVLADDAATVDEIDGTLIVYAGPRLIDLRVDAAHRFPEAIHLGVIGSRARWRIRLPLAPPATPLAGWVTLAWGSRIDVISLTVTERLGLFIAQRGAVLPPTSGERHLALATLPMFRLTRPRDWSASRASAGQLLQRLQGQGAHRVGSYL